jgi:AbrB family looped-hinge helix DNA binding protein
MLTVDEKGRLCFPEAARNALGLKPGVTMRVEISSGRIEIVQDAPEAVQTAFSTSGRLVLAGTGEAVDVARAIREERDALAARD